MNHQKSGFTLIELMVAVAVIGLLAAIAYPAYTDSVIKSRRSDGKAKLLEVAQRQERYYTERNTYTTDFTQLGYATSSTVASDNGFYSITVAATSGSTIANSFTLTAAPVGSQTKDVKCNRFTLTNTNVKGISSGTSTASACW